MQFRSIFITGTDTGVGKTTIACGIAAALVRRGWRVGVLKPAETGCHVGSDGQLQPEDALRLKHFARCRLDVEAICPHRLRAPLAPLVAAQQEGRHIDVDELVRTHADTAATHDITLIEGAGGLLVPLAPGVTFADLAGRLKVPVLVVVGSRLGAINHALLTIRHAECLGLHVLGYVVNFLSPDPDVAAASNVAVLADWLGPPLGIVPHLGGIEMTEAERGRLADVFTQQLRLDGLLLACT